MLKVRGLSIEIRSSIYNLHWFAHEGSKRMCCIQLLNESFSVKTENSNVVLTLRGFCWYPYFVAPE